jgi:threonine synthase
MSFATGLLCRECGTTYPSEARYSCDFCFGPLEVDYDLDAARGVVTRPVIADGSELHLALRRAAARSRRRARRPRRRLDAASRSTRLAEVLGVRELWLKDDTRNPTGSFKDRVVSVALSSARRLGFTTAACASTGNLATSVAAHAAFIGWPSVTIIPADLEKSKIAMTAIFGGTVLGVEGNYDDVNRLCVELVAEHETGPSSTSTFARTTPKVPRRWPSRSPSSSAGARPTRWSCRRVGQPVHQGRQGLQAVHRTRARRRVRAPVLFGAQATGCSPIATAFASGPTSSRPSVPTRSRVAGHRQPGRRSLRARRAASPRRRLRVGARLERSSSASDCSPRPRASSPRRPAA